MLPPVLSGVTKVLPIECVKSIVLRLLHVYIFKNKINVYFEHQELKKLTKYFFKGECYESCFN